MDRLVLIQVLALLALAGIASNAAVRRRNASRPGLPSVVRSQPAADGDGEGGTSTEAAWFVRLHVEQRRHQRYGRTATIVAMHLGGPTGALGRRAARRRAQDVWRARRIAAALRSTDIVEAGSDGIIRVLLSETDEDGGVACVGRLAERLPGWAAEVGAASGLTAAWATTQAGRDLWAANRLAIARLRGVHGGWLRSAATHIDGDGPFSRRVAATAVGDVALTDPAGQIAPADKVSPTAPEPALRGWRS